MIQKNKRGGGGHLSFKTNWRFPIPPNTCPHFSERPTLSRQPRSSGPRFGLGCCQEFPLERGLTDPPETRRPCQPTQLRPARFARPAALSQHQVLHQPVCRGSPQQPLGQFFPNLQSRLQAHFAGSLGPVSSKEDAPSPQPPPNSKGWRLI